MTLARIRTPLLALAVVIVLLTAIAAALTGGHRSYAAEPVDPAHTVTVSGSGTVEGRPDTLDADFSVNKVRSTVRGALGAANSATRTLIARLKQDGVAGKDLHTSGIQIDRNYKHGRPSGYYCYEGLSVHLHPLTSAARILDDAVTAVGSSVSLDGLSFDITDSSSLVQGAQERAFAQAKAAATKDASLAGKSLGDVVSIKQTIHQTNQQDSVPGSASSGSSDGVAALPLQAGQQPVSVTVNVVWVLQ